MPALDWASIGTGAVNNIIGAGMGLLLEGHNDRRQLKQQQALLNQQYKMDNAMANQNWARQYQFWEATNYDAQVQQLKKAGLNPALLYSKGGPGGVTGQQGAHVASANAPTGGMEVMNMIMNKAQLDLIRAQTEKTKAEATKTAGIDTQVGQQTIEQMKQQINSAKTQQALTEVQTAIASITEHIMGQTQNAEISKILAATRLINNDASISDATKKDIINRVHTEAMGAILQNWLTAAQTKLTNAQTKTEKQKIELMIAQMRGINANVEQGWRSVSNETLRTFFQNAKDQGLYDDADKAIQDLIDNILIIPGLSKGGGSTPIRGFHQR